MIQTLFPALRLEIHRNMLFRRVLGLIIICLLTACGSSTTSSLSDSASVEYLQLLAKFSENRQGEGREPFYTTELTLEPMTYALVLSSESLHYRSFPSAEGLRRIRNATNWLIANSDTDADGKAGWGLQDAWDAFSDGSVNPPNHPYTITTAIVLMGLLDACQVPGIWAESELAGMQHIIIAVSRRWCIEVWTESPEGGFFWYSPSTFDNHFVINASAMMMGVVSRAVTDFGMSLPDYLRTLFSDRVLKSFNATIGQAKLRNDAPFWSYIALPNAFNQDVPNDLVHHVYILWGIDQAISCLGESAAPWWREMLDLSLDKYWRDGVLYDYPQDVIYSDSAYARPAVLWGVGAILAYYAAHGDRNKSNATINVLKLNYGPFPDLKLWPATYTNDGLFYARYAAHALWGLSYADFK